MGINTSNERVDSDQPSEHLSTRATVLGVSAGAALGSVAGLAAINSQVGSDMLPSNVPLAEGLAVNVYAQPGGSTVAYGPTKLDLPNVTYHSAIGKIGAHIDISQFNTPLNHHGLSELIGLANNLSAVDSHIKTAVIERLAGGAGIGALAGALTGAWLISKLRQPEPIKRFKANLRPTKIAAIGAAAACLAGCGAEQSGLLSSDSSGSPPIELSSILPETAKVPELAGSSISSTGAIAARFIVSKVELYIKDVGKSWRTSARNFNRAFYASQEINLVNKFRLNSNIVGILDIADMHCNYAADQYYFPTVLKAFKPNIVNITADTYTNSDTMPYEDNCASDFVKDVNREAKYEGTRIPIINVNGNHDPERPMPGTITLDKPNNYSTTIDGITFAGIGSWPRTTWVDQPATAVARNKLLLGEAKILDRRACQLTAEGKQPIIDVDEPQVAFEAMHDGCASLVNAAETHHEQPIERYISKDGSSVLWHMAGTATGANIGLTIEETQQLPATATIEYFNTKTWQFAGFITAVLSSADNVSFNNQAVPGYGAKQRFNLPSSLSTSDS